MLALGRHVHIYQIAQTSPVNKTTRHIGIKATSNVQSTSAVWKWFNLFMVQLSSLPFVYSRINLKWTDKRHHSSY